VTRPRAADDFATIRSRLEELRREREEVFAASQEAENEQRPRRADTTRARVMREMGLLPSIRRGIR